MEGVWGMWSVVVGGACGLGLVEWLFCSSDRPTNFEEVACRVLKIGRQLHGRGEGGLGKWLAGQALERG